MKRRVRCSPVLLALLLAAGCATTKVTERQAYEGGPLPRPDHVWVYDFAATPGDAPGDAEFNEPSQPQSAKEIDAGRKLGAEVAKQLAAKIEAMGLTADVATDQTMPAVNDIVIKGYFTSIEEGSMGKRLVIGFGSGNADLQTNVEAYQMTSSGLRKLGGGSLNAGGGKMPGVLLPLAVTAATANPIGLVVGGAVKAEGEISGRSTIEGSAKRTADEIATQLQSAFEKQGWI